MRDGAHVSIEVMTMVRTDKPSPGRCLHLRENRWRAAGVTDVGCILLITHIRLFEIPAGAVIPKIHLLPGEGFHVVRSIPSQNLQNLLKNPLICVKI